MCVPFFAQLNFCVYFCLVFFSLASLRFPHWLTVQVIFKICISGPPEFGECKKKANFKSLTRNRQANWGSEEAEKTWNMSNN